MAIHMSTCNSQALVKIGREILSNMETLLFLFYQQVYYKISYLDYNKYLKNGISFYTCGTHLLNTFPFT